MLSLSFLLYYLLGINLLTFFVYGVDKLKAKHKKWRISEFNLLLLACIGGSLGAWCAIKLWRHKTLDKKFKYGIPIIFLLQLLIAGYFLFYYS